MLQNLQLYNKYLAPYRRHQTMSARRQKIQSIYVQKWIFFLNFYVYVYGNYIVGNQLYEPLKICLLFICKSCLLYAISDQLARTRRHYSLALQYTHFL